MLGDLYRFDLAGVGTWTELVTTGSMPGPRSGHGMVISKSLGANERLVVFGGTMPFQVGLVVGQNMQGAITAAASFFRVSPFAFKL
jgi:hypothetical protein